VSPEFQGSNFTTVTYSQLLNNQGLYFIILGANDGSMTAFDVNTYQFLDAGIKKWVISGEIAHCRVNNGQMVVASSSGTIARFQTTLQQMFSTDAKQVQLFRAEGPIVALCMDDLNNEGLVGTAFGTLFYINFDDKLMIRVVSKPYSVQKPITSVKFSEQNPQLIISNICNSSDGNGSGIVKVWTTPTLDQVMRFSQVPENAGPAVFVLSGTNGAKYSIIGHQLGVLRLVNIECLRVEATYRVPLAAPEEYLTSGVFNPNGINFAIGTSHGSLYLGSLRDDAQSKPKFMLARLEPNGGLPAAITSLEFSAFDPIGSFLVAMDNGMVKTWQTSVRNEQFLKLLEIQQQREGRRGAD
jgi:WD40 repeat protein